MSFRPDSYRENDDDRRSDGESQLLSTSEDLLNRRLCLLSGSNMTDNDRKRILSMINKRYNKNNIICKWKMSKLKENNVNLP